MDLVATSLSLRQLNLKYTHLKKLAEWTIQMQWGKEPRQSNLNKELKVVQS